VIHDVARTYCGDRWVATGGGGYQYDTIVPRVWTIHFAELCGVPEVIPAEWLQDRPSDEVSRPNREQVSRSVEDVLTSCLPRLEALSV
jgi:acetoin utilization protein AcuC